MKAPCKRAVSATLGQHTSPSDRMDMQDPDDSYVRIALMVMLSVGVFAGVCATLIHWLGPVHRPMDLVVPPVASALFGGLLVALVRRPRWLPAIVRIALLVATLALVAPAWFYTLQAITTPGVRLITTLPPVPSLFVVLLVMVMVFIPGRQAFFMASLGWILIALPVLAYLFAHRGEMWTPRGMDLLMAYGPVSVMVVVLLPVQRGLTSKVRQLAMERARMEVMLHRDSLTGVHNRRLGERVLQDLLGAGAPAGAIMFDLDRFKSINDVHGHPVGDRVLQAVADLCRRLVRDNGCVARWGGEEFLVVVPNVEAHSLQRVAERLRGAIADLSVAPARQVTASFGVTMLDDSDSLTTVLQRADRALYQAKWKGGNCVVIAQPGDEPLAVASS